MRDNIRVQTVNYYILGDHWRVPKDRENFKCLEIKKNEELIASPELQASIKNPVLALFVGRLLWRNLFVNDTLTFEAINAV